MDILVQMVLLELVVIGKLLKLSSKNLYMLAQLNHQAVLYHIPQQ